MKRINPLISIAGVAFVIDVVSEEFIDFSEPNNRISFGQLLSHKDGYIILFDPLKSNVWTGSTKQFPDYIIKAHLSAIVRLDPIGLSHRLNKSALLIQKMKSDAEWLKNQINSSLNDIRKWHES